MKKLWYGFCMAWGMFLAVPCPFRKWDEEARSHMLLWLPFTGAFIGGVWAFASWGLAKAGCPSPVAAAALAALPWALSGFIHLDGFMDVADAVLSRRDIETRVRILKDPHTGSFAVIAMVLLALVSFASFLAYSYAPEKLLPLALIPVASRASAGAAVLLMKPMSTSQYSGKRKGLFAVPLFVILAAACAAPIVLYGVHGLAPLAAAAVYWVLALVSSKQLGGINGDVSGYALTGGEAAGVLILALLG